MQKGHSMTDEIDQARKRVARAASNNLTSQDRLELSTVSQNCRNDHEGAVHLLNQVLEKARQEYRAEKARQADLFDHGLMCPTGQDTAMAGNDILRSSLFGAVVRGKRQLAENLPVLDWGKKKNGTKVVMTYYGAELDQGDLDTLMALGRMIQTNGANVDNTIRRKTARYTRVYCSARALLKDTNRPTGGSNIKWLYGSLNRLGGKITLSRLDRKGGDARIITSSIVGDWEYDKETKQLWVEVNHDFIHMLKGRYTVINWRKRLAMSPFGKWLYGFVCTHKPGETQFRKTIQLMESYRSHHGRSRDFLNREIRPALEALKQEDIIVSYSVKGHLITWTRSED